MLVAHVMEHSVEISNKLNIAAQNLVTVMIVYPGIDDSPLSERLDMSSVMGVLHLWASSS